MINIIIIIFVFLSNLARAEDFKVSRFENFWKRTFNKMNFRSPIVYMPYTIKIGYHAFGDSDYWKKWNQIFKGEDDFGSNPFTLSNQNFPDIANHIYRRGVSFELDILKVNFFSKNQNIIDIQLGLGYKYNKTIKSAYYEDINLKPKFHNLNINSTFIFQWDPKFFTYFYYSLGPTKAIFYETPTDEATGDGFNHSIGLGGNFITPSKKRDNNLNYGFEFRGI